jgi:hypothetical protein
VVPAAPDDGRPALRTGSVALLALPWGSGVPPDVDGRSAGLGVDDVVGSALAPLDAPLGLTVDGGSVAGEAVAIEPGEPVTPAVAAVEGLSVAGVLDHA